MSMNVEENRLCSFDCWPGNAPVSPCQLARCGFFATGSFLETECNWCHGRINDWQCNDQIEERHRNMEPLCQFLVNAQSCGNVPLAHCDSEQPAVANSIAVSTQPSMGDLLIEANRLATFKNWPNPNISPQSLAKAGFYYLNRLDQVKCAWCKGVMAEWEKHDNAFEEHKRFFPDCPRVQLGPLIEIASDGIRDLGIQQISPPKKPKFSSLDARLRTYCNWPISDIQRPEALAEAGLYYQNVDDQVRCFHCNIGLRSWQKEDDPWFEHAKWFPQCQFVRLVKGVCYVEEVQELIRHSAQQETSTAPPMTTDEAMNTAPVRQALEMGIDGGSIRNATQLHLSATGRPYDTVEDLLKAVFGDPDDSEPIGGSRDESAGTSDGAGASIVREVSRLINNIFSTTGVSSDVSGNVTLASFEDEACQESFAIPRVPLRVPHIVGTDSSASSNCSMPTKTPAQHRNQHNGMTRQASTDPPASPARIEQPIAMPLHDNLSPKKKLSLEEENRQLKDARLCKVCLDGEVGVVFLPCGHLVTCVQCAPGVTQCPMCRTTIKGFVRTFLS